jgi:polysaccharide biosynthesis/export protein
MNKNQISKLLVIIFFISSFSSCISIRRSVYLKNKSMSSAHNAVYDTTFTQPTIEYKIQKTDILNVEVNRYKLTDQTESSEPLQGFTNVNTGAMQNPYLKGFVVHTDGTIDLPVIGSIKIVGLSLEDAREVIRAKAEEFYSEPTVKIFLLNSYISVIGEVNRAGRYPVFDDNITILEALALAGDCTDFSEKEKIKVLRNVDGQTKIYFVDVTDMNAAFASSFYMQPNDIIMVKAQGKKRYNSQQFQQIITSLSAILTAVNTYLIIKGKL